MDNLLAQQTVPSPSAPELRSGLSLTVWVGVGGCKFYREIMKDLEGFCLGWPVDLRSQGVPSEVWEKWSHRR